MERNQDMKTMIAALAATMMLAAAPAAAMPMNAASAGGLAEHRFDLVHEVSRRGVRVGAPAQVRPAPRLPARQAAPRPVLPGGPALVGRGGRVQDTCTSTDPWGLCDIDDFIARCDAAGGGLSTQPGGGIDCDTSGW
jgi:hypothetical protein